MSEILNSEHLDIFLNDDNDMSTTTALVDVKAGLPEDFFGRSDDARRWILAMSAYFNMCRTQYTSKQMKLILLNKMSKGWGTDFSEGWLFKIADDAVPEDKKTKELIVYDFEKVFLPTDKTSRAQAALANICMEGPPFRGYLTWTPSNSLLPNEQSTCATISAPFVTRSDVTLTNTPVLATRLRLVLLPLSPPSLKLLLFPRLVHSSTTLGNSTLWRKKQSPSSESSMGSSTRMDPPSSHCLLKWWP